MQAKTVYRQAIPLPLRCASDGNGRCATSWDDPSEDSVRRYAPDGGSKGKIHFTEVSADPCFDAPNKDRLFDFAGTSGYAPYIDGRGGMAP
jgi:hypothetical protein